MVRVEQQPVPEGMAGSTLNIAMERMGLRSQMRDNGPLLFDESFSSRNLSSSSGGSRNSNMTTTTTTTATESWREKKTREKLAMDKSIVEVITSGQWERLEANSGRSVPVGNHHVCVSFDEQREEGYRTWEWHGHMLLYDEQEGSYKPEYVYGNYFEPLDNVLKIGTNLGLERKLMSLLNRQHHRFY